MSANAFLSVRKLFALGHQNKKRDKRRNKNWFRSMVMERLERREVFAAGDLLISEYVANPASNDTNQEYVELIATRAINFSITPYSVVWTNNGSATAAGWIAGGALSYGFNITSGTVNAGDVVYVGGSGMAPTGTKLRVIDVTTSAGDGFGNASTTAGVLGNGGTNADSIGVFDVAIGSITNSTIPIDAVFFGTAVGSAVVSGGSAGYQLPVNDRYSGGKLQTTSFLAPEPATNGTPTIATGSYNPATNTFPTARTWANSAATSTSAITLLLPEVNVQGNNIDIADGDTTPDVADHTSFVNTNIGSTSTRTYTIQNTGTAALTLGTFSSTNAAFTIANAPTGSIAAGTSSTFDVLFAPTAAGQVVATIAFVNNDSNETPYNFDVSGTGVAQTAPEVNVQGNSVTIADGDTTPDVADHTSFVNTDIGSTSVRTFTIQNTGTAPLTLGTFSSTNAAFTIANAPTGTIAVGGSALFGVVFAPTAAGLAVSTIAFVNNDSDENPYDFVVGGTGVAAPAPEADVYGNSVMILDGDTTPSNTDHTKFTPTSVGSPSTRTFTITNSGTANLTFGTISSSNPEFVISNAPSSPLAAGASATFDVVFTPTSAITSIATISFSNNDSNENPYDFVVEGEGTSGTVTPTVTVTSGNKVYDSTVYVASASLSGAGSPAPAVTFEYYSDLAGTTVISAPKNVGTYYVRAFSESNGGNNAAQSAITSFSITPFALTATATAANKVYDGNTNAVVTITLAGVFAGDTVTGSATGNFNNKNVGDAKPVTVSTIDLEGVSAGNYTVGSASTSANITRKALTVTITTANPTKTYDGNTTVTTSLATTLGGVVSGDTVTASAPLATYDTKQAGSSKIITLNSITLGGTSGGNYTYVAGSTTTTGTINKKTVGGTLSVVTRQYDGTTAATLNVTVNPSQLISGDVVTGTGTGNFDDKNVGASKQVSITPGSIVLGGQDGGNYFFNAPSIGPSGTITRRQITATPNNPTKVYDGNITAPVVLTLNNVVPADTGNLGTTFTASYNNKNVGTDKPIAINGVVLTGLEQGNYQLTPSPTSTIGSITARSLNATGTALHKVYDATVVATTSVSLEGIIGSESVSASVTGKFDNKNVGNGKIVTLTGYILSGTDAGNYSVSGNGTTTANITRAALTATGSASNKVYDSTVAAATSVALAGVLGSDSVSGSVSGSFDNKNVSAAKTVTLTGYALSGTDFDNYTVTGNGTTTADITAKSITGSITAANKIYDSTTTAIIVTRNLSGVFPGDVVSYIGGTAIFDTPSIGTGKLVTATGLTLSGDDSSNYTVNSNATATADILASSIVNRGIMYFNSTGNGGNAVATDKTALLPGQSSTYANYTNYSRGLNGLVVDINVLPTATTNAQIAASLQFARWDGIAVGGFTALPAAAVPTVTILPGAGVSGSARVRITFPDNSLKNTWLRVTVLADTNNGLGANDVFYFGNAVGDFNVGNTPTRIIVNDIDTNAVRTNQSALPNSVGVTNIYDVNRDGSVDAQDTSLVKNNQQVLGIVAPITAPSSIPPVAPAGSLGVMPPVNSSGNGTSTSPQKPVKPAELGGGFERKLPSDLGSSGSSIMPIVTLEKPSEGKASPSSSTELTDKYFSSFWGS